MKYHNSNLLMIQEQLTTNINNKNRDLENKIERLNEKLNYLRLNILTEIQNKHLESNKLNNNHSNNNAFNNANNNTDNINNLNLLFKQFLDIKNNFTDVRQDKNLLNITNTDNFNVLRKSIESSEHKLKLKLNNLSLVEKDEGQSKNDKLDIHDISIKENTILRSYKENSIQQEKEVDLSQKSLKSFKSITSCVNKLSNLKNNYNESIRSSKSSNKSNIECNEIRDNKSPKSSLLTMKSKESKHSKELSIQSTNNKKSILDNIDNELKQLERLEKENLKDKNKLLLEESEAENIDNETKSKNSLKRSKESKISNTSKVSKTSKKSKESKISKVSNDLRLSKSLPKQKEQNLSKIFTKFTKRDNKFLSRALSTDDYKTVM